MVIAPFPVWVIFFVFGIFFGSKLYCPVALLFGVVFVFCIAALVFLRAQKVFYFLSCCLAFLLGMLVFTTSQIVPKQSLESMDWPRKQRVVLGGVIISDPIVVKNKTSFILEVSGIGRGKDLYPVSGRVWVRWPFAQSLSYGNELLIRGTLFRPQGVYARAAKIRGANFILNVKDREDIEILKIHSGLFFKSIAFTLKSRMKHLIEGNMPVFSAGIFEALLLGDKEGVPHFLKQSMIKNGTWHILVVSGSHMTLVVFISLFFFKMIRIPRRARFVLSMGFLAIYCLLTGATPPVVRSAIMAIVIILSFLIERHPLFYQSLSLAGLFILIIDPSQVFGAGFQLSFASVFFIVYLFPRIKKAVPEPWLKRRGVSFLIFSFIVSLSAWLGTLPIIAYMFRSFSPLTVAANMIIVPLAMVITAAGFGFLVLGSFWPALAQGIGISCDLLIFLLVKISLFFSRLPLALVAVPAFPGILVFMYYFAVFYLLRPSKQAS